MALVQQRGLQPLRASPPERRRPTLLLKVGCTEEECIRARTRRLAKAREAASGAWHLRADDAGRRGPDLDSLGTEERRLPAYAWKTSGCRCA